jgi:hypothetical protein
MRNSMVRQMLPLLSTFLGLIFLVPNAALAQTSTPALGPGWQWHQLSENGYALGLPPSWTPIDLAPATISGAIDKVTGQDPRLKEWLPAQIDQLVAQNISFTAFDFTPGLASGIATNLIVMSQPLSLRVSVDTLGQINVAQMEKMPGVVLPILSHHVTMPASGDAYFVQTNIQLPSGTFASTQYYWVGTSAYYVLTFTTTPAELPTYAPEFDAIAQTFMPMR